jgi:putative restriction endonuclease
VWDAYGIKNGAPDFDVMASQLKRYRPGFDVDADSIGCLALTAPFFLKRDLWIDQPADWPSSAQTGKTYDSTVGSGASLWERVQVALAALATQTQPAIRETLPIGERYGAPILVAPRLGQGTFRAKVIDAYERRCAVTNERTLPVLQASHIKPYSKSGPHAPENGLLLRSDLHTLFDRGYLTVTPARTVMVSRRIKEEFENGRDYYALDGRQIRPPARGFPPPSAEYLEWHADTVFKR